MSTVHRQLKIRIAEWPSRQDLSDFSGSDDPKAEIREFLSEEFDTEIHFQAGDDDLLGGYAEAFIMPLHAFARGLSQGSKQLALQDKVSISLYLQQYEIKAGDKAHTFHLTKEGNTIKLEFVWGGDSAMPAHLPKEVVFEATQFHQEVRDFLDLYTRKFAMLLGTHEGWSGEEIAVLFQGF